MVRVSEEEEEEGGGVSVFVRGGVKKVSEVCAV